MIRRLAVFVLLVALSGCSGVDVLNALASGAGKVRHDVAYGPLDRQKLDIYEPDRVSSGTPVLFFIHGGSWQNGSKDDYAFLGDAFASAGVETVVIDYGLYPPVIFPDFVEDAARALVYAKRNIAHDRPLILAGHSAGAHIAAMLAADPRFLDAENADICTLTAGFIGISGPYDFTIKEDVYKRIFPKALRATAKPVNHADGPFPPALLLHGTADHTVRPSRTTEMAKRLRAAGDDVRVKMYEGLDHVFILGAVAPLLRGKAPTFRDMLDFIHARAGDKRPAC